jgi:hypothetical protein
MIHQSTATITDEEYARIIGREDRRMAKPILHAWRYLGFSKFSFHSLIFTPIRIRIMLKMKG